MDIEDKFNELVEGFENLIEGIKEQTDQLDTIGKALYIMSHDLFVTRTIMEESNNILQDISDRLDKQFEPKFNKTSGYVPGKLLWRGDNK